MRQLGQVEVLVPTPWYQNENFWMGFASSLVAATVFWYFLHDVLHRSNEEADEEAE